jgi:hypothetical protein
MESFKEDLRKWTNEEIENQPGRLAAQIVLNRLIKNDFQMWFVGNVDGNQLYTVTLSNEEKAIVSFTDEYIASNYINRSDIIRQVRKSFGPKVVLVSMSLQKIDEIMKNNMTTSVSMGPNALVHQVIKTPIQTVIVNPNAHDFFIPLNIPYIMQRYNENDDIMEFSIEGDKENKELSIYEIDKELKKYVFSPDSVVGEGPESEDI